MTRTEVVQKGGGNLGYIRTGSTALQEAFRKAAEERAPELIAKRVKSQLAEDAGVSKNAQFHMENYFLFRNDQPEKIPLELQKSMQLGAKKVAELQSEGHAVLAFRKQWAPNDTSPNERIMDFAVMDLKNVDKFLRVAFSGYSQEIQTALNSTLKKLKLHEKAALVTEMTLPDDPARAFSRNSTLLNQVKESVTEQVVNNADTKWQLGAKIGNFNIAIDGDKAINKIHGGSKDIKDLAKATAKFGAGVSAAIIVVASLGAPAVAGALGYAVVATVAAAGINKGAAQVMKWSDKQLSHAAFSKELAREEMEALVEQNFSATMDKNIKAALRNIEGVQNAAIITDQDMSDAKTKGKRGGQVEAAKQKAALLEEQALYDTPGEQAVARLAANGSAGAKAALAELDQLNLQLGMIDRQTANGKDQYARLLEVAAATANEDLGTNLSAKSPQELLQTLALASRLRAESIVRGADGASLTTFNPNGTQSSPSTQQDAHNLEIVARVQMIVNENSQALQGGVDAIIRQQQESTLSADARQTLENIAANNQLQQNLQYIFDFVNSNNYSTQNVEPARAREAFILKAKDLISEQMPSALQSGDEDQVRQAAEHIAGELWDAQAVEIKPMSADVIDTINTSLNDNVDRLALIEANLREAAQEMADRDVYSTRIHEQAAQKAAGALRNIIKDESVTNEQIVMIARAMTADAEAREQVHSHARTQYQAPRSFAERAEAQMQADGAAYTDVEMEYLRTMRKQHANLTRGASEQDILNLLTSQGRVGQLALEAMNDARKTVKMREAEASIKPGGDLNIVYEQTKEQLIKYYEANEQFANDRKGKAEEMAKILVGVKEVSSAPKPTVDQMRSDLADFMRGTQVAQSEIRALEHQFRLAAYQEKLAELRPNGSFNEAGEREQDNSRLVLESRQPAGQEHGRS